MGSVRPGSAPEQVQAQQRSRVSDVRAGDSHPRTAAGPPSAPKLDKRTFLVEASQSHNGTLPPPRSVWTIKIHDFGKQWVEASWGQADPRPGKKSCKGRSPDRERNEKRAWARATGEIRRKCITIGTDHLVAFTYRRNMENRERLLRDLDRLRRMLLRTGYPMPFVAVMECQQRGAIHPHLAVQGFQDVRFLRRCWYKIVGNGEGQVNVRDPRPGSSPVQPSRYLSKYISKDFDGLPHEFGDHRYFCSLGITVLSDRIQIVVRPQATNVEGKMYAVVFQEILCRTGEYCTLNHWSGGAGTYDWMSGFEDRSSLGSETDRAPYPHRWMGRRPILRRVRRACNRARSVPLSWRD